MTQKNFIRGVFTMMIGFIMVVNCGAQSKQGLYEGNSFIGEKDINESLAWISQNVQSGKNYTIVLGGDQVLSPITLNYGGRQAKVTIKASEGGGVRKITSGYFIITDDATLVIEEGIVLTEQRESNEYILKGAMVCLEGGNFIMNGGEIRGNNFNGVGVFGGTFTMNGGTISENRGRYGYGVWVFSNGDFGFSHGGGTFIMNDGIISGNRLDGVRVDNGSVFKKTGGIIYGSDAPEGKKQGRAVYHCTDSGGKIWSQDTTADKNKKITLK